MAELSGFESFLELFDELIDSDTTALTDILQRPLRSQDDGI
jgi:hypothetical protein